MRLTVETYLVFANWLYFTFELLESSFKLIENSFEINVQPKSLEVAQTPTFKFESSKLQCGDIGIN